MYWDSKFFRIRPLQATVYCFLTVSTLLKFKVSFFCQLHSYLDDLTKKLNPQGAGADNLSVAKTVQGNSTPSAEN